MAIETEQLAEEELVVFVEQMNASEQEVEELKGALAQAAQEVDNLSNTLHVMGQELGTLRSEGSWTGVNRISDAFGRRSTLLFFVLWGTALS